MCGAVFICATATRPVASCPLPAPSVWLNQGRCAGAFAWVRTQTLCLPASALIASISSRALLESPPGAGAFIVAVAMTFSPVEGLRSPSYLEISDQYAPTDRAFYPGLTFSPGVWLLRQVCNVDRALIPGRAARREPESNPRQWLWIPARPRAPE